MGLRFQAQQILSSLVVVLCLSALTACQTVHRTDRTQTEDGQVSPLSSEELDRAGALARFGQGVLYDLNDESGPALTNFLEAARLDPDNEELHFRVTMGLLRDHRFEEAQDLMEDLCARRPKSEKALLWLALVHRAADENEKALATYQRTIKIAPTTPVAYLESANILVKEHREPEAVAVLERGIQRVPAPADLLKYAADILIRRVATAQATPPEIRSLKNIGAELENALTQNPEDVSLLQRLGDFYIVNREVDKAVACFEKIEQKNPGDLRTKQKLALSFLAMGDKEKAIEALEKISAEHPDNARVQYYLGEIFEQTGEREKADAAYEKATHGSPPEPAAYLKLSILRVDNDPDAAIAALNRGREKLPKDARLVEMLAYVYLGRKDYAKALENFSLSQRMMDENKTEPMTPNFSLHYAIAMQMAGQTGDAATLLFKAMRSNPAYLDAYIQYMFREQETSNLTQGVSVLTQIGQRAPDDPQLFVYIGLMNSYAKLFPASISAFEKAEQLAEASPEKENVLTPMFYFWFGSACERDGKLEKAEQMFRKCIDLDPEHAEAYNYIAYMWAEKGQKLKEALELSKKSLELAPDSAAFIDTLGWIYFMQGEYKQALQEIQRAANLLPEDPTIVEHLGDVMDKMGKQDKALIYWKRSYVLDPENEKLATKLTGIGIDLPALKQESERRDQERKSQKIKRAVEDSSSPPDEDQVVPDEDR